MWKVLHDLSPNDLHITVGESGRLGIKAKLPALPRQCKTSAKSLYDSSFAVMGPRLWNAIPEPDQRMQSQSLIRECQMSPDNGGFQK